MKQLLLTFWNTNKATLESKKFVAAYLSTLAAAVAHLGFSVPIATILVILSPIMIAIGAQGWADSGKEAAKINAAAYADDVRRDPQPAVSGEIGK